MTAAVLPAHAARLPRRVILGWSPPGVCTACGQGLRPVVDRSEKALHRPSGAERIGQRMAAVSHSERERSNCGNVLSVHRITGYACACGTWPITEDREPDVAPSQAWRSPDTSQPGERGVKALSGHIPPIRPAIVLDPFGGTGTTALVASVLGRHGISVDLSMDYARLAKWRVNDHGERARALMVPKPPPQVDGQDALFEVPR